MSSQQWLGSLDTDIDAPCVGLFNFTEFAKNSGTQLSSPLKHLSSRERGSPR